MATDKQQIGLVSTRFAGTDGVSLEARKWVETLRHHDFTCSFFAGESDHPADVTYLVPQAHFLHPDILALDTALFKSEKRSRDVSARVQALKEQLKDHLYRYVAQFDVDLLVVENALALPVNVPLGLALTEFIAETNFPTVAHHHDFRWERDRYDTTAAVDYFQTAFPPTLRSIQHVVINSFASHQLALRAGVGSLLIPNVMDFEHPPAPPDDYAADLRAELGIGTDDWLLLQPTRIVPRKQIERAIDLTAYLGERAVLVISHSSGDEGLDYEAYLREYIAMRRARVIFAYQRIAHERGTTPDGRKVYSLADVYRAADLVTYTSSLEGFGNAFLETIYYRRPIVLNLYEIFRMDIQPKGFQVIGFSGFVTPETVREARTWLEQPELVRQAVERNYQLALRYYSYRALEELLIPLINSAIGNAKS